MLIDQTGYARDDGTAQTIAGGAGIFARVVLPVLIATLMTISPKE